MRKLLLVCSIVFIIGNTDRAFAMDLHSDAFVNNTVIPKQYTCDGASISPELNWQDVPANTKSLALIVDDPDAPRGTWTHWVLYNLPSDLSALSENLTEIPFGAKVGVNSWGKRQYGGPCPPSGRHRYYFRIFALDVQLNLPDDTDSAKLQHAMRSHILAKAELVGFYR